MGVVIGVIGIILGIIGIRKSNRFYHLGVEHGKKSDRNILDAISRGDKESLAKIIAKIEEIKQLKHPLEHVEEIAEKQGATETKTNSATSISLISDLGKIDISASSINHQILYLNLFHKEMQKNMDGLKKAVQEATSVPLERLKDIKEFMDTTTINAYLKYFNKNMKKIIIQTCRFKLDDKNKNGKEENKS